MNTARAIGIFKDIYSSEDEATKALAIYKILDMPTHNSITKKDMLDVINYLWDEIWSWEDFREDTENEK